MTIFLNIVLILFLSFLLVKATDILVTNFKSLSNKTRLSKFALTGLILGLATSLPELFVGITSALEGQAILSLGNIIGANIVNISLVIGGAALVGGGVLIKDKFLNKDIFYAFLAATSPMLLLADKNLSRTDGVILIILYCFYQILIFSEHRHQSMIDEPYQQKFLRKIKVRNGKKEIAWILFGIALMLFAADALVKIAIKLALSFNIPLLLVGLLIVSLGTTLPELVFNIEALKKKQPTMVLGNLLGSIVANGTLIIGVVALISPIRVQSINNYLLSTISFLLIFIALYFFMRTKKRLDPWEGGALVFLYFLFVFLEFKGF